MSGPLRKMFRFRFDRHGGDFAVLVTHWFFLTNHAYPGERRFWVRVGQWRRSFGARV